MADIIRDGIKYVIAAAGMAAHLPGALTAHLKGTGVAVIGVALSSTNFPNGMDAVMSVIRMPPGIPLVCAGIDWVGAKNAALFVAEALAGTDNEQLISRKTLDALYQEMIKEKPAKPNYRCGGGAWPQSEQLGD